MPQRPTNILLIILILIGWVVVPRPAPADAEPLPTQLAEAPFGLNTHLASRYTSTDMSIPADLVAQAGASWARED
ncbi:hypothetical protein SE17_26015, partial [Kouleothrix aurantiaca]